MTNEEGRTWMRAKVRQGVALLVLGLALVVLGVVYTERPGSQGVAGLWIGSLGVLLLVVGGLFCKWGIAGPLPSRFPALEDRDD